MRIQHLILMLITFAPGIGLAEGQSVRFLDMISAVPAEWMARPPSSGMRLLEFSVPARGAGDEHEAELVMYYFGPGQGGTLDANVARWTSQFSGPNGPVEPLISELDGEMPATLVELSGDYARGAGMGPVGDALPDRMLLAAVVDTPQGRLFPQLHGPEATVSAQRDAFVAFIKGIRAETPSAPDSEPDR